MSKVVRSVSGGVKKQIRPWKVLKEVSVYYAGPWFKVAKQMVQLPNGDVIDDYHQIIFPDYVTIVARTDKGKYLILKKYCHGFRKTCLVLPGGLKNRRESPRRAAARELFEETGYVSRCWRLLGSYMQHSNYGCGSVHMFMADRCREKSAPASGDIEEMEIIQISEKDLTDYMESGKNPSLSCVAAYAMSKDHWRKKQRGRKRA